MSDETRNNGTTSRDGTGASSFVVIVDDDVAYVRRHLAHFAGGLIFVESLQIARLQEEVQFTFQLEDGTALLSGTGIVTRSVTPADAASDETGTIVPGMVIRVESASDDGYTWLREAFYAAQDQDRYADLEGEDDGASMSMEQPALQEILEATADEADAAATDFLEPLKRGSGGPIVGIDLGTTNSCVSAWNGSEVVIIPSTHGDNVIPSVVALDGDEILTGRAAAKRLVLEPDRTVYGSKRLIGRKFTTRDREQLQRDFHYSLVEGDRKDIAVQIGDRKLDLRSVSALILSELRSYAEAYLDQPVLRAVITVPAYFNENQRYAVRDAGMQAGLVVERILNEPTAAALAYGYDRAQDKTILVYDLGGGTFDASLLHVDDNVFRVLATGGDTFLGGIDFDNEIVDYLLEQFFASVGAEVEVAPAEMQRLLLAAQEAKHGLTVGHTAEVMLPHFVRHDGQWHNLEVPLTREKMEELTGYLVDRTIDTCRGVLASQKMTADDVDVILLVGGQSRMPLIHERIEKEFGRAPSKQVNPDEAVGLGAGIYANLDADADHVKLQDVLPIAIGVGLPGGRYQPILEANTPIPAGRTIPLTTFHDDQETIEFDVFQGDSPELAKNEFLGTFVIDEIPNGPRGSNSFGVEFGLNAECLLIISAINYNTGQTYEKKLITGTTAEEAIQRLKLAEAGARAFNIVSARAGEPESVGTWSRFSRWLRSLFGGG